MTATVAASGARGAGVTVIAQALTMGLQFIGVIIMARLLMPDDYGLLAIVTVLMGIGTLIRDFGMGTASIQERDLSSAQASNLFWANGALTLLSAVVLGASAPLIAMIFDDSRLIGLVPVMAVVLLITGLQTQYQARLARGMRFTALACSRVLSIVLGIVIGIVTALSGWGYWALAAQQLAIALCALIAFVLTTRWVPSLPSRGAGSREHVRAGANYGFANVLGYVADNIDTLVIGARWDAAVLGTYNRAFQLFMQPVASVFSPLSQVVIPTINRASTDWDIRSRMLLRVQSGLVGLATWALLVTAVTADWLIPLLLGDQWRSVVPLLQILAVGGVFKALSQINYWAYVLAKESKHLLMSNLVTKPIQIALIVVGAFFGVEWVAWAFVMGRALSWPINLIWLSRVTSQKSLSAFVNGIRIFIAAAGSYGVTRICLESFSGGERIWMIAAGFAIATATYVIIFLVFPGGIREAKSLYSLRHALSRNA